MGTLLIAGTEKGAFLLRGDPRSGAPWTVEGPLFKGWKVTASARTRGGPWVLATASRGWGAALQRSTDLDGWTQVEHGPAWPAESGRRLDQIWTVLPGDGERPWWAGVSEAGLFKSEDDGATWRGVEGLNEHPTRSAWVPGAGGLCAHALLVDPADPRRMWVGISAVGVFRSEDSGATWRALNRGVECVLPDEGRAEPPEVGYCVHALAADPRDANRIWRREHRGMYRSDDGGDSWLRLEAGLPSTFGFPLVQDPGTGALYCVPLESDEYRMPAEGRLAVYRSVDGGEQWTEHTRGLPEEPFYGLVLRHAMTVDASGAGGGPAGVYFGTSAGTVHGSVDGGDSWWRLPGVFPRILTLAAYAD